jgi:putative DNA methylase
MTTYRKKLIEVALPLEAINKACAREKSIRQGHPSTLHLWWARRPLAAARAVIFTSLVDDPDSPDAPTAFVDACKKLPGDGKNTAEKDTPRQRLFDFIERLVSWEATTDEAILEKARELIRLSTDGNPPPLLDPFAGGGSIPLEAQRLGLEAHASDLNPVAVMINKAMIEIPPKFANMPPVNPKAHTGTGAGGSWKGAAGLADDVRYYGQWMREKAFEKIGHLYPKHNGETVIAWLWARTIKCPNPACGAEMPLVKSFWLSNKKGKKAWIEPRINEDTREITFEVRQEKKGESKKIDVRKGTVNRGGGVCIVCNTPAPFTHIREEGQKGNMDAQLLAIVTEGNRRRNYYAPNQHHINISKTGMPNWFPKSELVGKAAGNVHLYGLKTHADLFTPRQLTALTTFSDLVADARQQIENDAIRAGVADNKIPLREGGTEAKAYAEAVSIYLAFGIDRGADYWSTIATWHTNNQQIRATFARQAIPMTWDFVEPNLFSNSSGGWDSLYLSTVKAFKSFSPSTLGTSQQNDANDLRLDRQFLFSTDPPYYNNINYADLSDYFYIWLRHNTREIFPEVFTTMQVPKLPEVISNPYLFSGNKQKADQHFETGLYQSFCSIRKHLDYIYPFTVYYAFKQSEVTQDADVASTGWEKMLIGLMESGFLIIGTWPIRSEQHHRMIAHGANALASSIVLVCRPRPENAPLTTRREFINALRRELPPALREMQTGNIAPVDMAQASIGPGMAVYSRYSKVLEADGSPLTVRAALQIINQELDAYLAEQEGEMDSDSRFAVAWFQQFGFKEGAFGQADVLARAKNTSVQGLEYAGVLHSSSGKVRLRRWDELDAGWDPEKDSRLTLWESVHHLIERLNTYGEEGVARLLAKLPPEIAADVRQMAYRLYSICERKGWAEEARNYNALVVSWGASQEQAREFKTIVQQEKMF